jgi:hypothetical protein
VCKHNLPIFRFDFNNFSPSARFQGEGDRQPNGEDFEMANNRNRDFLVFCPNRKAHFINSHCQWQQRHTKSCLRSVRSKYGSSTTRARNFFFLLLQDQNPSESIIWALAFHTRHHPIVRGDPFCLSSAHHMPSYPKQTAQSLKDSKLMLRLTLITQ